MIFLDRSAARSVSAMARGLDARQQAELTAFVNDVYAAAGYTTTAEWSRESGYPASNLSNLRNGKGAIDGYNLLRLMRSASARVDLSPLELALDRARPSESAARQEAIERLEAKVDAIAQGVDELRAAPTTAEEVAAEAARREQDLADSLEEAAPPSTEQQNQEPPQEQRRSA